MIGLRHRLIGFIWKIVAIVLLMPSKIVAGKQSQMVYFLQRKKMLQGALACNWGSNSTNFVAPEDQLFKIMSIL